MLFKRGYRFIIGFLILIMSFELEAQTTLMVPNENYIDTDFVPNSELMLNIYKQKRLKKDINLILKKPNDSLYSIYVFNNTSNLLKISRQDGSLFLIQEAKDENNDWKPIEYWLYSWCGNSYLSKQLEPNGILKTESKVYKGSFETEIRFKLLNGDSVYYSNSLKGFINLSQFNIPDTINEYRVYNKIKTLGGLDLLTKIIFLEPDGLKELQKKE